VVSVTSAKETRRGLSINMESLGLSIRSVVTAGLNALIPIETEPAQVLKRAAIRLDRRTIEIGVLNSQ
jgi:hypothetical protein